MVTAVAVAPDRTDRTDRTDSTDRSRAGELALVTMVVVLHLAFAWVLTFAWGVQKGDALARTANAYYVIASRDPHLAALGFVWNPLPSLLQIPILVFGMPIWNGQALVPAVVSSAFAGPIVTALASGLAALYAWRTFRWLGAGRWIALFLLAAYSLHPLLAFYNANGMSEALFLAGVWASGWYLLAGEGDRRLSSIIRLGLAVALTFLTRYEGIVVALVVLAGLLASEARRRTGQTRVEALSVAFVLLPLYAVFLWIFANWLIMGSPLFFLNGDYSNAQQVATVAGALAAARGSAPATASYVLGVVLAFSPLFLLLALPVTIWGLVRREIIPLVLVALWAVVPILHAAFIYAGESFGWSRFFLSVVPGGIVLAAWFAGTLARLQPPGVRLWQAGLLVGVIFSLGWSFGALGSAALVDERTFAIAFDRRGPAPAASDFIALDPALAPAIESLAGPVLLDTFLHYAVVLQVADPKQLVITSDRDFAAILNDPTAPFRSAPDSCLRGILVPNPDGLGQLDAVNVRYPDLYRSGTPWTGHYQEFAGGARLYQVRAACREER